MAITTSHTLQVLRPLLFLRFELRCTYDKFTTLRDSSSTPCRAGMSVFEIVPDVAQYLLQPSLYIYAHTSAAAACDDAR